MSRRWWVLLGALAILVVVLGAAWANRESPTARPSGSPTVGASSASPTEASPIPSLSPSASPSASGEPNASATPAPPGTTPPPRASGPPRLAYAAFLSRINADRATAATLSAALSTAAQAQDPAAVRAAAVDILDFVDVERDWLRDNPPTECYAGAHASAGAMLDAFGAAADAFIAWAETGGGFAGLLALGDAVAAADVATDALASFGAVLDATRCPA